MLSYVYSNVKECLVCMEEVADTSIIPIYGNGNTNDKQQAQVEGVWLEERMRHFGNVLIAMGEIPRSDDLEDTPLESERTSFLANQVSTSQALPSTGAEVSRHNHSVQVSRLLFQGAASLSSFSSAVNSAMNSAVESAERLVEDLEAVLHNHGGRRNHQQSSRPADRDSFSSIAAVIQPDSQNLDTVADADSMLPHSASSSRPDDAAIASQFESRSMGEELKFPEFQMQIMDITVSIEGEVLSVILDCKVWCSIMQRSAI
ncbi:E3 UBIQUITIN-PROTEIN LIGASE RNF5-RELATED [Salix purpurea]|uniref:E3 UBIQUITIN-PROTEIN LIGASE RNF5-RELATED n=1 Tax=Salix purpurea TaxID=77065 RepID=A0A9Q0PNP8_SALPP|nr:E3 UBIQUITIN-PROTEIN LIGASE RNF5-RELATED [Salix purpurea]